jgi:Xaa-Pro dipeptidase
MLFNKRRAERLVADCGLDAVVASSAENVLYMTGFECTTHWINKSFQQYALFSPGHAPEASLIVPGLEIDSLVDGDVWIDDFYVFSPFKRGRANDPALVDEIGRKGAALVARAPSVGTATDGLVAAIEARGLQAGRIGFDESGLSIHALEEIRRRLPNLRISYAANLLWEIRMVKTPEEIERLERSTHISESAIRSAFRTIKPGVTEGQLIDAYHREIAAQGAMPTFCVIGSGSRSSYPHSLRSERAIQTGDIVRYDVGCTWRYYHSDHARAIVLGQPTDEQRRIWDALAEGVEDAVAAVKPGATAADLFNVAMAPGRRLGLDNFDRFHCGHGIGISVYDPPVITASDPTKSAFLMPEIKEGLEVGMVINIEVGYYLQGVMGFLCEDTMVVTPQGSRVFTRNSKSLDLQTFLEG